MKFFRLIGYFFRQAGENVFENPFLNTITVGIIAVTLFLFSSYILFLTVLGNLFDLWGQGIRVSGYLDYQLAEKQKIALMRTIEKRPEVEKVIFVSQDEALERFRKMLRGNTAILRDLQQHNPLPQSFEISLAKNARDYDQMEKFANWLGKQPEITDVTFGQEWVERFSTTIKLLRVIGVILGGLLILAAMFIVANTIRITLFARKNELKIMQLVGATDWFIQIPFVLEGSLQGILGAGIALIFLYFFHFHVIEHLNQVFAMPELPFLAGPVVGAILLGGMLLGAGGSLLSVGRFLRSENE